MDTFITVSIVAIAAFWALASLRRRFASKRAPACGGCSSGCDPVVARRCGVRKVTALVIAALALAAPPASIAQTPTESAPPRILAEIDELETAFESASGGISLSGFCDVQAMASPAGGGAVAMGDFEVDLAKDLGKNTQVAAALVANEDGATLAVGFVDVHLFGGRIAPRGRLPVEKGFHRQIGRFDVPFGNDWQYLASKDRSESSAPLTTDLLMDGGHNDVGH